MKFHLNNGNYIHIEVISIKLNKVKLKIKKTKVNRKSM